MEVIRPAVKLMNVIGKQTRMQETHYRLLTYCMSLPVSEGILLYNVMTKCMVLLSQEEYEHLEAQEELIDQWFLVPENHDDRKLCLQVRSMAKMFSKKPKGYISYNILTTTDCNARCFYCYEKGCSKDNMSIQMAKNVGNFIIDNYHKNAHPISLNWFGGEPTYNVSAIREICQMLKEATTEYYSNMVSNAYLFDKEMIQEAVEFWKLKKIQITLDGPEAAYNKIKAYIYKTGNPYARVLENIHTMLGHGIFVVIRLNVDGYNADFMLDFAKCLKAEFENYSNFSIYAHALFETVGASSKMRTDEERKRIYEVIEGIARLMGKCGHMNSRRIPNYIAHVRCFADGDGGVLISPKGFLGKCEHYVDSDFFGHINSDKKDHEVLQKFSKHCEDLPQCDDCAFYPDCIRLEVCGDSRFCFPENKNEKYLQIVQQMKNEYAIYLKESGKI